LNLLPLYQKFICVRVTDMRGVDLSRYVFDFDLTFAALMMHPDGTIYHRYGSRDFRSADVWLSSPSWEFVLRESLRDHALHQSTLGISSQRPNPLRPSFNLATAKKGQPVRMENIPSYQERDKGSCIHCHSIHPAFYQDAVQAKRWRPELKWVYPGPDTIGIELDADQQRLVMQVASPSIARHAGLQRGDQLLRLNEVPIASVADLMFALDTIPSKQRHADLEILRQDQRHNLKLKLNKDWRVGTPRSFAWRPFKWGLTPAPGFGGPELNAAELQGIGLDPEAAGSFAFRVQYLVTWGENRRYGKAAAQAGLRQGDIVLSLDDKSDFDSVEHFHAWWRLTRKVGQTVKIEILRSEQKLSLHLKVLE
jgi:serine protease Do